MEWSGSVEGLGTSGSLKCAELHARCGQGCLWTPGGGGDEGSDKQLISASGRRGLPTGLYTAHPDTPPLPPKTPRLPCLSLQPPLSPFALDPCFIQISALVTYWLRKTGSGGPPATSAQTMAPAATALQHLSLTQSGETALPKAGPADLLFPPG